MRLFETLFSALEQLLSFATYDPDSFRPIVRLILITWTIHILNWGIGRGALNYVFGIHPRQIFSFPGIITSHFLHRGYVNTTNLGVNAHISANTLKFLTFGYLVASNGVTIFRIVTLSTALCSGLGAWLFGVGEDEPGENPDDRYIGSEGVIFGYMGFLLVYGLHESFTVPGELTPNFQTGPVKILWLMLFASGILIFLLKPISNLVRNFFRYLGITRDIQDLLEKTDLEILEEAEGVVSVLEDFQRERRLFESIMEILFFRHVESVLFGFIGGIITGYALMLPSGA